MIEIEIEIEMVRVGGLYGVQYLLVVNRMSELKSRLRLEGACTGGKGK